MRNRELTGHRIDSAWWTDVDFDKLSGDARLIWIGLCMMADGDGNVSLDPRLIFVRLFPYTDRPHVRIRKSLDALIERKLLLPYEVDGKQYASIVHWSDYVRGVSCAKWRYPKEGSDQRGDEIPDEEIFVEETTPLPENPVMKEPDDIEIIMEAGATINTRDTKQEWQTLCKRFGAKLVAEACRYVCQFNNGVAPLPQTLIRIFDLRAENGSVNVNKLISAVMARDNMEKAVEVAHKLDIATMELPNWLQNKASDMDLVAIAAKFGL